ncbi:MAG: right-handed parallel beta-helix repeat-containing protein, partial [Acidobacteriota bacterium]
TGRTGYYNGTGYTSLSAWKAAGHGQDANSIAVEPREISAKNQRICEGIGQGTNPLVGQGVAITGVTTDIGGATRSSPPTIGAHETPLAPLEGAIGLVSLDGSGAWQSIKDAIDEVVARGVSAAVTVSVAPGTYAGEHRVKTIPGASATNTVTFEKSAGLSALIDATGADYGIYFDSASHVTFKGIDVRNSGNEGVLFGGTSTSSRIVSTEVKSVGLSASVPSVKFESGTIGCKVQKCEVLGDTEGILVASATDAEISNSWIRGGANYGLHLQTCNGAKVYFNSFRDMASGTPDQLVRIDGGSTTSANILKNNIFQMDSTASDYCIYVVDNGNAFVSDYNDFWIPNGAKAGYWNGSARATLLDWRGAGHSEDAHSLSGDPVYVSIYDLH